MGQNPTAVMQGIEVPTSSIDPANFFRLTRRLSIPFKSGSYGGLGQTDTTQLLQTGIVSGVTIKASGSLTVTPGAGTVATTSKWPYGAAKNVRFSANGQSNLINCSGTHLKIREIMQRGDLTDRGVTQSIGGAHPGTARNQGTLSLASEAWGVGQNVTAIPGGTYPVELEWYLPVAFDDLNLLGAIFAQTSATDLVIAIDWANTPELFTLTGNATVSLSMSVVYEATLYTIPQGPNGSVIVPDLSAFHSIIQTRYGTPTNSMNEIRLAGQGVGKQLLRLWWQSYNNGVPLPLNATNYGQVGWRYGGNDTPEIYPDGKLMAYRAEKLFNSDFGSYAGVGVFDFCSENAFRDSVDEGTATELRLMLEFPNALSLTAPYVEYVAETVSAGASA
ncbi:hypothetical protein [Streptomyces zaomyceticus]|uniref:hypothetical protein n=1 Tax=Streptomyces zaomyceticus TaxID=68286 RepID=UPI0036C80295